MFASCEVQRTMIKAEKTLKMIGIVTAFVAIIVVGALGAHLIFEPKGAVQLPSGVKEFKSWNLLDLDCTALDEQNRLGVRVDLLILLDSGTVVSPIFRESHMRLKGMSTEWRGSVAGNAVRFPTDESIKSYIFVVKRYDVEADRHRVIEYPVLKIRDLRGSKQSTLALPSWDQIEPPDVAKLNAYLDNLRLLGDVFADPSLRPK